MQQITARCPWNRWNAMGKVPGAKNIPLGEIPNRLDFRWTW